MWQHAFHVQFRCMQTIGTNALKLILVVILYVAGSGVIKASASSHGHFLIVLDDKARKSAIVP